MSAKESDASHIFIRAFRHSQWILHLLFEMKVFYLGNTTKRAISPLNLKVKARAMYHDLLIILWLPIMGHSGDLKFAQGPIYGLNTVSCSQLSVWNIISPPINTSFSNDYDGNYGYYYPIESFTGTIYQHTIAAPSGLSPCFAESDISAVTTVIVCPLR